MAEERTRSLEELIDDDDLMTAAIREGVREELLLQARLGNSVPVAEGDKIVWLSPTQIFEDLGFDPSTQAKAKAS